VAHLFIPIGLFVIWVDHQVFHLKKRHNYENLPENHQRELYFISAHTAKLNKT